MADSPRFVYDLLYIEDKSYDLDVVRAVLKEQNPRIRFNSVPSPAEALAYLRQEEHYANAPVPDIVLVDLKGPDETGFELLRALKSDVDLRRLPVVCFVGDARQLQACYDAGANCCLDKPKTLDQLALLVAEIDKFWFRIARTPFTLAYL